MNQDDIILTQNSGFQWYTEGYVSVKGYGWIYDEFYSAHELACYLSDKDKDEIIKIINTMNGCFAIISNSSEYCIAAVDHLRSIPLFYTNDDFMITDDPINIYPRYKIDIDKTAFAEMITSGMFTANNRTLYDKILQIPAGTIGIISKNKNSHMELQAYYIHKHSSISEDIEMLYQQLDTISTSVFSRLIQSVQGKTIIIPLSGGYDSRYIVSMLVKLNYRNIVCYTYGKSDSYEVMNSKAIAKELGLKWFFIEYNEKRWLEMEKSVIQDYCYRTFMCSSIPHLQEIIAFLQLCSNPDFPSDGVVVPGFCGDLIGGSFVLPEEEAKQICYNKSWLTSYIINSNYSLDQINKTYQKFIIQDIEECIDNYGIDISTKDGIQSFIEAWFTVHRPAKYVIQSNRLYELFGYEWRMPLWDQELVDFWYKVPSIYRTGKLLYEKWLFEKLFVPMKIDMLKENTSSIYKKAGIKTCKDTMRKIDGALWLWAGIKLRDKWDPNGFKYLSKYLFKQLKKPYSYNYTNQNINYRTAVWFLEKYLGPAEMQKLYREITNMNRRRD